MADKIFSQANQSRHLRTLAMRDNTLATQQFPIGRGLGSAAPGQQVSGPQPKTLQAPRDTSQPADLVPETAALEKKARLKLVMPPPGFHGQTARFISENHLSVSVRAHDLQPLIQEEIWAPAPQHHGKPDSESAHAPWVTFGHAWTRINHTPTNLVMCGRGGHCLPNNDEASRRELTGRSNNYKGDLNNRYNHSDLTLPEHLNTSFWIENLPRDVTVHMLLGAIRNIGRVFATHVNAEEAASGKKSSAGAKITFFTVAEAQRFYQYAVVEKRLFVGGRRARVVRHRIRVAEQAGLSANHSRVILITGPRQLVNIPFITSHFQGRFVWQTDEIIELSTDPDWSVIEWRFSSWRAQARDALCIIRHMPVFRDNGVKAMYDYDPCAFPEGQVPIRGMELMDLISEEGDESSGED